MRQRSRALGLAALLAACESSPAQPPPSRSPAPPGEAATRAPAVPGPSLPPPPSAEETARHIDRIEHGLYVGARIESEPGGTLEERMRATHVRGLSVAVFRDFRVVWAKGYGVADADTGARVTETTLFQAGSISKPVGAMAVLKKVEDGKLSLESNVNLLLTSWKLPDSELTRAAPVTVRQLLSHTAGVNVHGFPGYAATDPLPTLLQVLDGQRPANTAPIRVEVPPGVKFSYSGGGITILQQALVDLEGKPFPQILAETVLGPLGMSQSTYEQPLPAERVPSAAAGYYADGKPVAGKRHVYPEMMAAGLWTTPTDLSRFAVEIALAASGKPSRVLSRASAERMLAKVAPAGGGDSFVGLGIFLERHGEATYFGHDGEDDGFQASLLAHPSGYGVAIMLNCEGDDALQSEVRDAVAAEYGWEGFGGAAALVTLPAPRLAELAGRYQVHRDRVLRIAAEGDHLTLRTPFNVPAVLLPISDATFVRRDEPTRYTFSKAADGSAQLRISPPPGDWPFAKRVPDAFTVPLDDVAEGRIDQAIKRYRAEIGKTPSEDAFKEQRFNGMGGDALRRGDTASAIALFRLNVALFPDSMNTYDSLGEGYMRAGDKAQAIVAYKKGLVAAARDKTMPAATKEALQKNAIAKLKELGAAP
jgi:CubicO group peptidase (beta-lactamase class C family)